MCESESEGVYQMGSEGMRVSVRVRELRELGQWTENQRISITSGLASLLKGGTNLNRSRSSPIRTGESNYVSNSTPPFLVYLAENKLSTPCTHTQ